MNKEEVLRYLVANNVRFANFKEAKGTKKQWADMYRVVFELEPRKNARKQDLVYEVVRYAEQQARAKAMRV